jgi:hypothetical protein
VAVTSITPVPPDALIIRQPAFVQKIDSIPVKLHQSIRLFTLCVSVPDHHGAFKTRRNPIRAVSRRRMPPLVFFIVRHVHDFDTRQLTVKLQDIKQPAREEWQPSLC